MTIQNLAKEYFVGMQDKNINDLKALADNSVSVKSPMGTLNGIEAFVGFQEGFARMIDSLTLNNIFVDGNTAAVFYTANTKPVPKSDIVEILEFNNDNKLVSTNVIYDGTPFIEYVKTVQSHGIE